MVAGEIMTPDPITVGPTASVQAVVDILLERDIRHVPVVDEDDNVIGIVSDRDLRAFSLPALAELDNRAALDRALRDPIASVMTGDVLTVDTETEVSEVIDLMLEQKVSAIPVVDPDTGEIVGIVSAMDVLRALRDVLD